LRSTPRIKKKSQTHTSLGENRTAAYVARTDRMLLPLYIYSLRRTHCQQSVPAMFAPHLISKVKACGASKNDTVIIEGLTPSESLR
jgi:hypothetical protein